MPDTTLGADVSPGAAPDTLLETVPEAPATPEPAPLVINAGFQTPESVLHDETDNVYLVSNINGDPTGKDDNGFISRVSPDGEVESLRWIDGANPDVALHAPKGLAIYGDTLFVSDIDTVRIFDRATGAPLGAWGVPNATFLNDVAVGPDGTVYVTDTGVRAGAQGFEPAGTDAVYRVDATGQAVAVASGAELNHPNGIVADAMGVIVVPFGGNTIMRLDMAGTPSEVVQLPAGQLDGVVRLDDGTLFVSSWEGQTVYRVGPDGQIRALFLEMQSPADIGYDAQRDRLLIPLFMPNRVEVRAVP